MQLRLLMNEMRRNDDAMKTYAGILKIIQQALTITSHLGNQLNQCDHCYFRQNSHPAGVTDKAVARVHV